MKKHRFAFAVTIIAAAILIFPAGRAAAEPLSSPTWGFTIDLPPEYKFSGGDGKERFSFRTEQGAAVDLVVYPKTYAHVGNMAADAARRLGSGGELSDFDYHGKAAVLMELDFNDTSAAQSGKPAQVSGWGLCVELAPAQGSASASPAGKPLLLALAYGPKTADQDQATAASLVQLSCLDSVSPSPAERRYPGPVSIFSYPRGGMEEKALAGLPLTAGFAKNDAEAAQALADREFAVLKRYQKSPDWQEAWIRFYRAIWRDSWERLREACFMIERRFAAAAVSAPDPAPAAPEASSPAAPPDDGTRDLAQRTLSWIQAFVYERNLMGSDFVNLVSAVQEGRGDCDSRAMLWAMILAQDCVPAAIMVSRDYSHAMGLADIKGPGARFPGGKNWMVAETTARVNIGMIAQDQSDIAHWLAVMFD